MTHARRRGDTDLVEVTDQHRHLRLEPPKFGLDETGAGDLAGDVELLDFGQDVRQHVRHNSERTFDRQLG